MVRTQSLSLPVMASMSSPLSPLSSPPSVMSKYVVGVCAMEKKTHSKPMREILRRLEKKRQFDVFVFDDETIFNRPVESWPVCDALISFYSTGFPLQKAEEYVRLVRPVLVNELNMQHVLFDRRKVYALLTCHGIQVPRHIIVNRDLPGGKQDELIEHDNYVEINNVRINKPFVEKPANAEDHNVYLYYPMSAGGGSKRLFRKVGDRSSEFYPDISHVRRDGSYIYEEFLNTQGTDVKVYTVGSSYGHAEARKSPVLDGRVVRDSAGKEVRYPVILNSTEKEMARKVCLAFHQTVCGFDLLRVRGTSYVCDVNGWSFVKNSKKYYDDCGLILHNYLVSALRSRYFRQRRANSLNVTGTQMCPQYATEPRLVNNGGHDWHQTRQSSGSDVSESSVTSSTSAGLVPDENREELRCVIAVVRHGDRTPKQKLKTHVWEKDLVDFYEKRRSEGKYDEVKVKSVADLQELLDLVRSLIKAYAPSVGSKNGMWEAEGGDSFEKVLQMKRVLERWKFAGINRKVQFKPHKNFGVAAAAYADNPDGAEKPKILMILKWGGDLTERGRRQGEALGQSFRNSLYPVEVEEGGLLRLHSTFRHDLKIFTSDEGRVQMTAAAFAKGFLELEGDLTPILVGLVTTLDRDANKMLDHSGQADATEEMQAIKAKLGTLLQRDYSSVEEMQAAIAPLKAESIIQALEIIKNPKEALVRLLELVRKLRGEIAELVQDKQADEATPLYMGETFSLMYERWDKIFRDFYSTKTGTFNLSKIPDVHDCIKYDLLHNASIGWKCGLDLFKLAEALARCYVSQEYGMDIEEKQSIGNRVSQALCAKIRADIVTVMLASVNEQLSSSSSGSLYGNGDGAEDGTSVDSADQDIEHHGYRLDPSFAKELRIKSPGTRVRTRLYFTSESHLHTLLNVLRFQCPSWRARIHDRGEDDEYNISLEQELFSNEILKRMGISVNDHMTQRKYVFCESKLISDNSWRALDRIVEINYLAHIVIRVFETPSLPEDNEDRFRVEISFSAGVNDGLADSPAGTEGVHDTIYLTKNMTGVMFEDMLAACVSSVESTST
ncbi:unnamed protein product [Peronospora effusa]|nr:unnamed protein product [Peronospora effusa]